MTYEIEVYEDFMEYEMVDSFEMDDIAEVLETVKKLNSEGRCAVVTSNKSGCDAYFWDDGFAEIHCGSSYDDVKDEGNLEDWF